ncbi:MAG: hypothetical protein JST21_05940 [Bacteroidetes bacterium]|nr:hypothetical protein [Bacteroidota bacterium]
MKKSIGIFVVSLLLFSCNQTQDNEKNSSSTANTEAHQQEKQPEVIELNNGQKWLMNNEMKPIIDAGENILKNYTASHSNDYKTLAAQLKEKDDALIKSCTMKGKSHEELHKWLHPHLELVDALANAGNEQQVNDLINQLGQSFQTFHQYFQ